MLDRIEFLHKNHYIHRDIKPSNFLIGIESTSTIIYMIDLGFAKKYKTEKGHIPFVENKNLTGTVRFCSCNAMKGYE